MCGLIRALRGHRRVLNCQVALRLAFLDDLLHRHFTAHQVLRLQILVLPTGLLVDFYHFVGDFLGRPRRPGRIALLLLDYGTA